MRTVPSLVAASAAICLLASPSAFSGQPLASRLPTWIGVQLEPVPPPLASQLKLAEGLMVRNLFVGSPADQAGLRQYDVLVEADGEAISSDVRAFSRVVQGKSTGDVLALTLYREGQRMTVEIRLDAQPENWPTQQLKYGEPPMAVPGLHGRILRRGPGGWEVEDLGPLPPGPGWTGQLREYVDRLFPEPVEEAVECRRVQKDGSVLQVRRHADGTVVVKRYKDTDGERSAEVKTYRDIEELRKVDPEANDLLESSRQERAVLRRPNLRGRWSWPPKLPKPDDSRSWDELEKSLDEWRAQIDEFRKNARRWRAEAEAAIREGQWDQRWREWYDRFFQGPMEELELPEASLPEGSEPQPRPETAEPPIRFELHTDGRITVHLRQGNAEMVQTYESEENFRQAAPELHESYRQLRETLIR